ncbi:NADP-dependent oxidoreductase [Mesonia sp.]|uniref:NADP-dependent oxidoreductase n=1 Tax=Mesonia sp. TaxID=1960830 RepID=UPI003F94D222
MKAIQHIAYGEISESIKFSEIEKPTISKDEVLIETYAASVNPLDIKVLTGKLKTQRNYTLPATVGYDVSDKIVEKGENITNFKSGDEVYAYTNKQGTFSKYVAVKKNNISLKPKNISFEEAASLPLVSLTAAQALKREKLQSGHKILIHAGSGGVGFLAIQLAKAKGADVYTTTGTDNVEWVKKLAADRVINYKTEDYKSIVKDTDMVLDTLGEHYTQDAFDVIKKGGRVITLVGPADKETTELMRLDASAESKLEEKRSKITKQMEHKSATYSLILMRANARQLNEVTDLIESGKFKPVIDKTFPLEETIDAINYVSKGRTKEKVVIKVK